MDTLRGQFSSQDGTDGFSSDLDNAGAASAPAEVGADERRMHVRAYNFWASLLDNRTFPDIAALHPEELHDFGPHSVLLDFTSGIDNPAIGYLGSDLAAECGAEGPIGRLSDVPARSLLSRITDHYMQILANQAPIGFEAEFVNQRGVTILYRGILLPFSRDDMAIDYIYGVINWKELADQSATDALMRQVDEAVDARPAMLREAAMSEWADGPADPGMGQSGSDYAPQDLPLAEFGMHGDCFDDSFLTGTPEQLSLGDWLAAAREEALNARSSEDRSRRALYEAVSRAYDFALAAAEAPEDFAELVEDAGLKVQERAPLIPLVKLVFGVDYDKTRLTEFATVIAHGQRLGIERGAMIGLLTESAGGLKGLVAEERRLRRTAGGKPARPRPGHEDLVEGLRKLEPRSFDSVAQGNEFAVLVARRMDDGRLVLLGEVSNDDALLDRAARHLLD
ncbi:hypothetical protein [Novosphingobium album (ex Hu et al. 2023)]|uniref:PAS domain-containing protein n=1 Tax=Novosphingobium album (ex Hu et al. 2023) TaxID=2930093 RepID=A0ABT0B6L9_9SPHN|nr:hypothetical protein [Novosphingobium album (ex Hu et al. 2023)]MCJ2180686.1 hypothetical protein [Novosphingobium album (ex Hu et al. 2023)]